jgi:hypothetical protein
VRGLNSRFKGVVAGIKVSPYKIVRRGFKVGDIVYNLRGGGLLIGIKNSKSININL